MSGSISREARELIARAASEERTPSPRELREVRTRVLAAGGAAVAFGAAGQKAAASSLGAAAKASMTLTVIKSASIGAAIAIASVAGPLTVMDLVGERSRSAKPRASSVKPGPKELASVASGVRAQALRPAAVVATELRRDWPSSADTPLGSAAKKVELERLPPKRSEPARLARGLPERAPSAAPSERTSRPRASLAEEIAVLEGVQAALREGAGARALAVLDKHPSVAGGQLRSERLAAEVFAACQAGELARAERAAAALLRDFPATPTSARVRASCVGAARRDP